MSKPKSEKKSVENEKDTDEIINFYNVLPKKEKNKNKYFNPNADKCPLLHPYRCSIIGASGSGKSNLALNIIEKAKNVDHIILLTKQLDEPLYKFLISQLGEEHVTAMDNFKDLPNLEDLEPIGQTLLIIDDASCEGNKAQQKLTEYFIRSRKCTGKTKDDEGKRILKPGKGVSCIYISQSYYAIPKTIRLNSDHLILKNLNSNKELNSIMRNYDLGNGKEDEKMFKSMYDSTKKFDSFFYINNTEQDVNKKYRKGFNQCFKVKEDSDSESDSDSE